MDRLKTEAQIFTHYLARRQPTSQAVETYAAAMKDSRPNPTDRKLLTFMVKHPRSIGIIDAGLVFHNPTSEARRRLYVMLAILEASTEYSDTFLPKDRGPLYTLVIFYSGCRAVIKALLGLILVKAIA